MPRIRRTRVSSAFAACAMAATAVHAQPIELMTATENEIVRPTDAEQAGRFGFSIAADGDLTVIGVNGDNTNGNSAGAAYVYRFDGVNWIEEAKLLASDGETNDRLGRAVAISDERVIVGAWFDDDAGPSSGSAYVFEKTGDTWVESTKLTASDADERDTFGVSVGIEGDAAIVGAPGNESMGSAYIFRYDGTQWVEEAKLTASDGMEFDAFGGSVAISDDHCLIGASGAGLSGAAYVFHFDGTDWIEQSPKLEEPNAFKRFGSAVALEGGVALVGVPSLNGRGYARIYRLDGTDWIEEPGLIAPDGMDFDEFGSSVDLAGGFALVGAWHSGGEFGYDTGAGYLFQNDGSDWPLRAKLTKGDGNTEVFDYFGSAVALSDSQALVGAYANHSIPDTSGAVYNYGTTDLPCPQDFDLDGSLDIFDVFAFLKGWNAQNPLTDWNSSGSIDHSDLFGYIDDFLKACP